MGRSNIVVLFFFSFIYLACMVYLVKESHDKNQDLIRLNKEYVEILDFSDRLLNLQEWVSDSEATKKIKESDAKRKEIDALKDYLVEYGYVIFVVSLLYVLILYFSFSPKKRFFVLIFTSIFISVVLLLHGVFNPILEIGAFKEDLTVKAKVTPIDTKEYGESKKYIDQYNEELNSYLDKKRKEYNKDLKEYQDIAIDIQEKLSVVSAVVSFIPGDSDAKTAIKDINKYVNKLSFEDGIIADEFAETIKTMNRTLLDSIYNRADVYAADTYGFNKKFEGKTYFYYEIKSIYSVIQSLWDSENYIVAVCVGLFSIVVPLFKILMSLLVLILHKMKNTILVGFIGSISKWSMADVFVLAAFLAYLSFSEMKAGVSIEASLQYGFYFFLMYVFLALVTSVLLKRYLKSQEKNNTNTVDTP